MFGLACAWVIITWLAGPASAAVDATDLHVNTTRDLPARLNLEYEYPSKYEKRRSHGGALRMAADVQPSQLLGRWAHSYEEDRDGRMVFRPFSFAFPPSRRGRTALNFGSDGDLQVGLGPGPDDRTTTGSGSWVLEGNLLTITGPWSGLFEIEAVNEHELVLRKRP
jgi:hypothetical protein